MKNKNYSVAIRTLGLAGDKFRQELISVEKQTIKADKIIVYIAEGYEIPKERTDIEEYVYVQKGMLSQRALDYHEIDSDYILLLDDDILLPENAVESLFDSLEALDGDAVGADIFRNQDMNTKSKIRAIITSWAVPLKDGKWAFTIARNGTFSYNGNPHKSEYLSQSSAGGASLWKKSAFLSVHLEDEKWLEKLGFAYGEDLLLFNKLYKNGGRLVVNYSSHFIHLDAGSDRKKYNANPKKFMQRSMAWFLLWHRISYNLSTNTMWDKCRSFLSFASRCLWEILMHLVLSTLKLSYKPITYYIEGIWKGYKFTKSEDYRSIPNFILK